MYHRRHRITTAATIADSIDQAVAAWYRDVEAVGDRQFQAGDRVICLKNRPRLGVLNGDLATITTIDPEQRTRSIRLDRTDRTVAIPHWYLDEGHLDWGYALTGHKAQGATTQRTHTVTNGNVSREWAYVTISRGREANTLYLTTPDLDQENCEHLAHQHPDRLPALITALGRAEAKLAAVDTGRGLKAARNEELAQRFAHVLDRLEQNCRPSGPIPLRAEGP